MLIKNALTKNFFIRFDFTSNDDLTILYTIFDPIKGATSHTRLGIRFVVRAQKEKISAAYYENMYRQTAVDTGIEVAKVLVIGEASLQESVPQSSLKEAVCVEFPSYQGNTNEVRMVT